MPVPERNHETPSRDEHSDFRHLLAERVAVQDPELNLIRRLFGGISEENVLEFFKSDSSAFFVLGQDYLKKHLTEEPIVQAVVTALRENIPGINPLLKTLGSIPLPDHDDLKTALIEVARSASLVTAELATKVICFRYPSLAPVLASEEMPLGVRLGLCYSKNDSLVMPLITAWGREAVIAHPPIALGLLISPRSLASVWRNDANLGLALAQQYGYLDDAIDAQTLSIPENFYELSQQERSSFDARLRIRDNLCDQLGCGLMVVDPSFATVATEDLQMREAEIIKSLLPWSTGMQRPPPQNFTFDTPEDRLLFLSAVRTLEKTNFDVKVDERPHTERGRENQKWIEFSYAPHSYSNRELITKPRKAFEETTLDAALFIPYAFDYAHCRLERDSQLQDEQLLIFESRWAHASKMRVSPKPVREYPIIDCNTFQELSELVLPHRPRLSTVRLEPLSHGANSARKLLLYREQHDFAHALEAAENHLKSVLPTVGIEIQNPFTRERRAESFAWKQTLRAFGIPSPRRPEYRAMVEAAFLPAFSYHAHIASLLILRDLGFFKPGEDLALHVSLSGKLGPDIRYLLFTQQFAGAPTKNPPGQKLMSKGFVHVHEDAVHPLIEKPNTQNPFRTELRSMRINKEMLLSERHPHFIDDIATFQLLGGALASNNSALHRVWDDFQASIDSQVAEMPGIVRRFLDADWFESTGDSSDHRLMPLLDIVERRREVLRWVRGEGLGAELRETFQHIRNKSARAAFDTLPKSPVYEAYPNYFAISPAGIPFLDPTGGEK